MNKKKTSRRLMTAALTGVLMISLGSCSGAGNQTGKLNADEVYAKSGNQTVTVGDIWNELKWNSSSVLTTQIENVVLNEKINEIGLVLKDNYSGLTEDEKKLFDSEEDYNSKVKTYKERIVDYVVQDIYNYNYSNDSYWSNLDSLTKTDKLVLEQKYVDELYQKYNFTLDIQRISNATEENNTFLDLAKELSYIYYPLYAKELFALDAISETIADADAEDTDSDDSNEGYFATSSFVSKFKSEYTNNFDVNLVMVRFSTESEYSNTLRAFGLKYNNNKLYFCNNAGDFGCEDMTYSEYIDYYDDVTSTVVRNDWIKVSENYSYAILNIYIAIYNYIYAGYRDALPSPITTSPMIELNDLRKVTAEILNNSSEEINNETIEELLAMDAASSEKLVTYTPDEINDISSSFKTYVYDTLELDGTNYSTSTQNYNSSYYVVYKFDDEKPSDYAYDGLTDDEIMELIKNEDNTSIYSNIHELLTRDELTSDSISTKLSDAINDDVKVKIYNEACEISYLASNSNYSKTYGSAPNSNVLATIKYNDKTWNLNILADNNDANSILIPGTTNSFGVYNYLETLSGVTTVSNIISKRLIMQTDAYTETKKNQKKYEETIEVLLYNFSNDGLSSSGYSSSLGKYNFLMLYFHTADIQKIVDEYYRVQDASVKLLVNYNSDTLLDNIFKYYADQLYDNYFSLSGTRLVVYFDKDDDDKADDIETWKDLKPNTPIDLNGDEVITSDESEATYSQIAKYLIYLINNQISASTDDHSTKLTSLVDEINSSARVVFDSNPILAENKWAKFRMIGLKVKTEEISVTNSTTDKDFNIKQRLFDYTSDAYQYFINESTPTQYIEPFGVEALASDSDIIIESNDGYNLLLVTSAEVKASAEFSADDYDDNLLNNIKVKYNNEYVTISDVYNDEKKLSLNQIKLYILEYVTSSTSNLSPSTISTALTNFLSPVLTRFTGTETQLIILKNYITKNSGAIEFTDAEKLTRLENIIEILKNAADNYIDLYGDTTGTSNSYEDWWTKIESLKEAE